MENYQNTQIEDLPNEIWKPVNGLEEFYQVSNLGRVKSIQGSSRLNDKILTQSSNTKDGKGYLQVSLRRGLDKLYKVCVHRLVAENFIENDDPTNKRVVNHKDENRYNNEASNLEWCSYRYNFNYSFNLHRKERIEKIKNVTHKLPKNSLSFAPWWHKGEVQKRSWECPGEGWERGNSKSIKELHSNRLREYNKSKKGVSE